MWGVIKYFKVSQILAFFSVCVLLLSCTPAQQEVSQPAPDFSLTSLSGSQVSLVEQQGKVVLLNFWASWCVPCLKEFPFLQQLQQDYAEQGFIVLAVNVDQDKEEALQWLKTKSVTFTVLFDSDSMVRQSYNVQGMPTSILVDASGQQRSIFKGYKASAQQQYHKAIKRLLKPVTSL